MVARVTGYKYIYNCVLCICNCCVYLSVYICVFVGEDFNIIQQEIAILADCKHPNIVGYAGSYLRYVCVDVCR